MNHYSFSAFRAPQRATEVEYFVGFSLKLLHCRDSALPLLKAIRSLVHFPAEVRMRIIVIIKGHEYRGAEGLHFSAFIVHVQCMYDCVLTIL